MATFVYTKQEQSDLTVTVNLASLMQVGESAVAGPATVVSVAPVTATPLVVSSPVVAANTLSLVLSGGNDTLSYGVRVNVTTDYGNTLDVLLAVVVRTDLNVPFATKNPFAFQSLVDEIQAGDGAIGKGFFVLGPGVPVANFYVTWELMDAQGSIYASGNAYDLVVSVNTFSTVVEANAVINVPSTVQPSLDGQKYQIRWSLVDSSQPTAAPVYAFEAVRVLGLSTVPVGVQDAVVFTGDIERVELVTTELFDTVGFEVFSPVGNAKLVSYTQVPNPKRTASGWFYTAAIDTSALPAVLEPYLLSWKYSNSSAVGSYRESARLFVINPSIANAMEDVRMMVNKAKATLFGFEDMIFSPEVIIGFLRRGMDMWNMAGGIPTTFNMTDATGGIRDFWIGYTEVAILQAQALAEGEKAFEFQGTDVQLSVDRVQYYTQQAESTLNRLNEQARPYKTALKIAGTSGGTGNVTTQSQKGNMPRLGITVHQASQFGRFNGPWSW